jgi:hypothetical protein
MPTDKPGAPPGGFEAYAADDHSLGLFRSPRKAVADTARGQARAEPGGTLRGSDHWLCALDIDPWPMGRHTRPAAARRRHLRPQSSWASRFTAGAFGFFIFSQSRDRPDR